MERNKNDSVNEIECTVKTFSGYLYAPSTEIFIC